MKIKQITNALAFKNVKEYVRTFNERSEAIRKAFDDKKISYNKFK